MARTSPAPHPYRFSAASASLRWESAPGRCAGSRVVVRSIAGGTTGGASSGTEPRPTVTRRSKSRGNPRSISTSPTSLLGHQHELYARQVEPQLLPGARDAQHDGVAAGASYYHPHGTGVDQQRTHLAHRAAVGARRPRRRHIGDEDFAQDAARRIPVEPQRFTVHNASYDPPVGPKRSVP